MKTLIQMIQRFVVMAGLMLGLIGQAYAVELDMGFAPNVNNNVLAIALQSDGKIVIAGDFTEIGDPTSNRIARLNTDGTLDMSFAFVNVSSAPDAIAIQSDGKILLSGALTMVNDMPRNRIARLNVDGTLDMDFAPNVVGARVNVIALQFDQGMEKILIGGSFTSVNDDDRNNLARLDPRGSLDVGFNPNANGEVNAIAIEASNTILIGGEFTSIGNAERSHVARLNTDGSLNGNFISPVIDFSVASDGISVASMAVQEDGKVVVAGIFDVVGDQGRDFVARLNTDGSLDTEFEPPNINALGIASVAIQADGKILLGGFFVDIDGLSMNNGIARLNADGSFDASFTADVQTAVTVIVLQAVDNAILIGGFISSVNGETRNGIARLENDVPAEVGFVNATTSQFEGDVGETIFNFNVSRNISAVDAASVEYEVTRATTANSVIASDFVDRVFSQGRLDFAADQSTRTISIAVAGDLEEEENEVFIVTLSNPMNAILGGAVARGVILDDDTPDDDLCLPIKASNSRVAVVCL